MHPSIVFRSFWPMPLERIQDVYIRKGKSTEEWPALIIIGALSYLSAVANIFRFGYHGFYDMLEEVLL